MPEVDKTIRGLTAFLKCNSRKCEECEFQDKKPGLPGSCKLDSYEVIEDALALLKEQEDLGIELTNAVELIHKKNERIEKLLKEQEAVEPFHKCIGNEFSLIEDSHFDYCPYCGKPITWARQEGR